MYAEVGEQHHTPHFHAYCQDDVAVYGIAPVELIAGGLPRRQRRLVEAWGELHQAELMEEYSYSTRLTRKVLAKKYCKENGIRDKHKVRELVNLLNFQE